MEGSKARKQGLSSEQRHGLQARHPAALPNSVGGLGSPAGPTAAPTGSRGARPPSRGCLRPAGARSAPHRVSPGSRHTLQPRAPFLRSRRGCVCSALSSSDGWEPLTLGGAARLAGGTAAGMLVQVAAWSGWLQVLEGSEKSWRCGSMRWKVGGDKQKRIEGQITSHLTLCLPRTGLLPSSADSRSCAGAVGCPLAGRFSLPYLDQRTHVCAAAVGIRSGRTTVLLR